MNKIYRIQVPVENGPIAKIGPFNASIYRSDLTTICHRYKDEIGFIGEPGDEGLPTPWGNKVSGYTEWQMHFWTPRYDTLTGMVELGFELAELEVPEDYCWIGKNQVVLDITQSKQLRTLTVDEYWDLLLESEELYWKHRKHEGNTRLL